MLEKSSQDSDTIIEVEGLKNYLGGQWVHNGIDMTIKKNEIVAIVGGSGSGKTTLLRTFLMLQTPTKGAVRIFGHDIFRSKEDIVSSVRHRWGVLFQQSALFSGMTVMENILFPIREALPHMPEKFLSEIALLKMHLVGLPLSSAYKYPSQLSGGMQKRAAAARAIAMDPELLFLDEATSGLDPASSRAFDQLVLNLRDMLGLTVVLVTHDPESLMQVTDRVAFLNEGKLLDFAPVKELRQNPHKAVQTYFKEFQ